MDTKSSARCQCQSDIIISKWSQGKRSDENMKCIDMLSTPGGCQWPFRLEDEVVLVVAKANQIRKCTICRESFIEKFHMPRFWWADTYKRMNGYFGSESTRNAEGAIESHSTWSRALVKQFDGFPAQHNGDPGMYYRWLKFNLFTRWTAPGKMIILAFDPVQEAQERLYQALFQNLSDAELSNPYWPYVRILEEIVSLHGIAVWDLRGPIRRTELSPTRDHRNLREKPKHDYAKLHDIARHVIHVSETLDLAVRLTEDIVQDYEKLMADRSLNPTSQHNIYSQLTFLNNTFHSLRCRSTSNHQRLNNEIQLRFHTDSQYDSQVSVEINHSTKSDSASMRWIAIVSLIFLPANLVSSIFSTTFFNATDGMVSVTNDFWIYWVVLVVVTAMTMVLWVYLPRLSYKGPDTYTASPVEQSRPRVKQLGSWRPYPKNESTSLDQIVSI